MTHPRAKQQEIEREARRRKVAGILLSGVTDQTAIAKQLGVSQPTIHRDVNAVEAQWREQAVADIATAKGRALNQISRMVAALWAKAINGDVDAINAIRQLLQREAAMLGYDAPAKSERTIHLRTAAEQISAMTGIDAADVLAEAERILAGVDS
jgi:predicted transcriptional regulator